MAEEKYPSAIDLVRSEIAKKRETGTEGELAALKSKLEELEAEAMQRTGLLDLDDDIGQDSSDDPDSDATEQPASP